MSNNPTNEVPDDIKEIYKSFYAARHEVNEFVRQIATKVPGEVIGVDVTPETTMATATLLMSIATIQGGHPKEIQRERLAMVLHDFFDLRTFMPAAEYANLTIPLLILIYSLTHGTDVDALSEMLDANDLHINAQFVNLDG